MSITDFTKKNSRKIAAFFLINFSAQVITPSLSLALTSGPSQPEIQEFQAINVSDMVDPSTGDFSYNLPLLDIDGYPLNLSYRAGVNMDQEATFTGLGWNLNAGSISRNLRGIPDDFNGDEVVKKMNIKDNVSYGVTIGAGGEVFGIDKATGNLSYALTYNNYSGYDFVQKLGFSIDLGSNASVGLGLSSSSDGLTIAPNLSLHAKTKTMDGTMLKGSATLGTSFNSRTGIKTINLSANASISSEARYPLKKEGEQPSKNRHSTTSNLNSIEGGSAIGFGSPTYVPQITFPMHTNSIIGSFKLGGTLFGVDLSATISGNYSRQKLAVKKQSYPAYGYLNLQNGQGSEDAMLDFNREKDGNFTEATTNLPIPNLTYDNFSVMGQGVGGSFRPFRSDIGYVFDPRASNTSESDNIGAEVNIGNVVQGGIDFMNTTVDGTSGKWSFENPPAVNLGFAGTGYLGYEPTYFKEMGEMNVDDDPLYASIGSELALRFQLDDKGPTTGLQNTLIAENSSTLSLVGKTKRQKRVKRNQLFSYITVAEYADLAVQPGLFTQVVKTDAANHLVNGHHIGEIITTKTDGTRYVYGLPVYNTSQKEVSFNVSGFTSGQYDQNTNMIQYAAGDDTENNLKGTDNFFSSTELPQYAYGYMLTAVLSPDYVDKLGDGPTPDDIGTYKLFKYDPSQKVNNYKWRSPHSLNGSSYYATLNEGLLTNQNDNKASYVYGTKDIYYLTSVESKNSIAVFNYSSRADGADVAGDAGGAGGNSQKKLDNIVLYSMPDFMLWQSNPASYTPFPIKTVNFNYSYELCYGTYNSSGTDASGYNGGKLTLKKVYFTYGNSSKGILSPYKFNYNLAVNGSRVAYSPGSVDRWGNYKPNNTSCPNSRYPYVEQDKSLEDQYASLWNLKSIQLPSGGLMQITYESDDYAYIQDKRAGEMFKMEGCSSSSTTAMSSQLFTSTTINLYSAQPYIFFKLKNNALSSNFVSDYLENVDKMYFNFFVQVNCGGNSDISALNFGHPGYEFVHGYAEIDKNNSGVKTIGGINYGVVKLKPVEQSRTNSSVLENPVSKAAWQLARTQTPKDAFSCLSLNDPASGASSAEGILKAMASSGFIKNTIQTIQGYNGTLKHSGYGQNFIPSLSWIRLCNPDYKKLGGGHRVKQVTISDQWEANIMLSSNAVNTSQKFQYGQQYDYSLYENGNSVSAGVSSYEPSFGADENSFRQPVYMEAHKTEALLAPDNDLYTEQPMGESFFPSPMVVYRQVAVQSLVSGSGKTVNEYYTAKDFPTYVHTLGMAPKRKKPNPILQLFSFDSYDHFTGSQGYSIELNDMHGKTKAVHSYEEGAAAPTNSTFYRYKQSGNRLVNSVQTVAKNGSIQNSRIGVDYDFYADFRENNTTTQVIGVQGNIHYFLLPLIIPIPVVVGSILPSFHSEDIQLRTAVTNKVIYKYGIPDKVETAHNGNISATSNLLWDAETGQVLLTAVNTEFNDPIYSMAYPGHWAYENLSGGYKDVSFEITNPASIVNAAGQITNMPYLSMLYPGDEIAITGGGTARGYVDKTGTSCYFTQNASGSGVLTSSPLNQYALTGKTIKVIRSGRHNLQDQKVAATTSFTNPLYNNPSSWPGLDGSYGITNATAIELGTLWQGYCGCGFTAAGSTPATANPNQYVFGIKGNPHIIKEYTYLTTRQQTKDGNSNIRIDGTFADFSPFWTPNGGNDWAANPNNWSWVSEAVKYSPYGYNLEDKDALNLHSAAQYGYNQSLPVAVSNNSRYNQAAYEGFEYNYLNQCADDHFGYNTYKSATYSNASGLVKVQKYAHTGKGSLGVAPSGTATITKQINPCP